jgi:hypothetical protein
MLLKNSTTHKTQSAGNEFKASARSGRGLSSTLSQGNPFDQPLHRSAFQMKSSAASLNDRKPLPNTGDQSRTRQFATRQFGVRQWDDPGNRRTYLYVPGNFTQQEARQAARNYRGYPVVFGTMTEWQRVMQAFDYRTIAGAHTGHYQSPKGREPGEGWRTYTGERSAPLNQLFNSDGPDDGVRNKWGFVVTYNEDGSIGGNLLYGPSKGKNEDAGVIWHDNEGRLEDVSVNARGGVLVEINR